jgi:hypothetical protein
MTHDIGTRIAQRSAGILLDTSAGRLHKKLYGE